ncbi:MAG: hypothetical protein KY468_13780 [Armatimonadetes bacterium]|nr:hypothetical protein [Armatimonadota bacterium]
MRGTRGTWDDDGEGENAGDADPLRPSALRVLQHAFQLCYDRLRLTLAGSLAVFLAGPFLLILFPSPAPTPLPFLQIVRWGLLLALFYPLMAGPVALAWRRALREDPGPGDLLRGWRQHAFRAVLLGLLQGGVGVILAGDLVFFLTRPQPILRLPAVLFGYLLLLWLLALPYSLPLLVHGFGPLRAFRQAVLLVLANPVFTGTISFVLLAVIALSAALWVPLMAVAPMWAAYAGTLATHALLLKYEALDEQSSARRNTEDPFGTTDEHG